ncbi:unannotated protein [freshwater metagenome]|uniref:Unannotated protein n=1 Tax=freshwater metagenome TaxID=449393 RepID=A0A6J7FC59_9ZZZZ
MINPRAAKPMTMITGRRTCRLRSMTAEITNEVPNGTTASMTMSTLLAFVTVGASTNSHNSKPSDPVSTTASEITAPVVARALDRPPSLSRPTAEHSAHPTKPTVATDTVASRCSPY